MKSWMAAAIGMLVLTPPSPGETPRQGSEAPAVVHIDGAKNPELVPQWNAWAYAFRVIAGGPRELPHEVHTLVSPAERAMVLAEAELAQKNETACRQRLLKARERLGRDGADQVRERMHATAVECRQATLAARDRVLQRLNPGAAAALAMFVESTKNGTTITVPKTELARFLEPE